MAQYYQDVNGTPYFEWMQKRYAGNTDPIPSNLSSKYKELEQELINSKISDPTMDERVKIEKTFKNKKENIKELLIDCIPSAFKSPSFHTTGHAFDISISNQYNATAMKVYHTHTGSKRLTPSVMQSLV